MPWSDPMPHDEMSTTEGEYVGKETPDEQAKSVTHITNNVLIQQMDVYPGSKPSGDENIPEHGLISGYPFAGAADELAQHASMDLDARLNRYFKGKVVRKDLTKQLKEGANVPVYVLEYLLGMYCASDDDEVVREGLENVKKILAENYVRPDEAEKVKSLIRERGSFKVIDKVGVKLNQKKDVYEAQLSNLGIKDAVIPANIVKQNEKLLTGGIWCIITLNYFYEKGKKTSNKLTIKATPYNYYSLFSSEYLGIQKTENAEIEYKLFKEYFNEQELEEYSESVYKTVESVTENGENKSENPETKLSFEIDRAYALYFVKYKENKSNIEKYVIPNDVNVIDVTIHDNYLADIELSGKIEKDKSVIFLTDGKSPLSFTKKSELKKPNYVSPSTKKAEKKWSYPGMKNREDYYD